MRSGATPLHETACGGLVKQPSPPKAQEYYTHRVRFLLCLSLPQERPNEIGLHLPTVQDVFQRKPLHNLSPALLHSLQQTFRERFTAQHFGGTLLVRCRLLFLHTITLSRTGTRP